MILKPFAKMQDPQNVGLAPPPLLREAVGNEVLLHHSSQSPQEQAPAWIMLREDGYDFCLLCNKVATEAHLGSVYHQKNLWWYRDLGASYWQHAPGAGPTALPGAAAVGASADAAAAPVLADIPQAPPLVPHVPLDWGNPAYYEWKPMSKNFWCKLCKKTATDSHVASDKHQKRATWPASYGFKVPATCENGLADLQGVPFPNRASQPEQPRPSPSLPSLEQGAIQWQGHWDA